MSAENHTRDASLLESYFFDWLLLNFYSSFHTFLLAKWEKRLKYAVCESTLSTAGAVPLPQWGRLRYGDAAFLASSEQIHAYVEKNTDGQSLPRVGKVASKASRIGYWRDERERGKASQVRRLREHPIHRWRGPFFLWGRLRNENTAISFFAAFFRS